MFRAIAAAALSLLAVVPALAALPPQYQRQRELQEIINSMEVVDAFGFDGISSIEYAGDDVYVVKGGTCTLEVTVVDLPDTHGPGWAGPREFTIAVGDTVCE